jgi:hypothetical protein
MIHSRDLERLEKFDRSQAEVAAKAFLQNVTFEEAERTLAMMEAASIIIRSVTMRHRQAVTESNSALWREQQDFDRVKELRAEQGKTVEDKLSEKFENKQIQFYMKNLGMSKDEAFALWEQNKLRAKKPGVQNG